MWVKYEIDKLPPQDLDVTVKRYDGQKTLLHELIDSDKYIIFDFFKDVPTPLGTVNKVIVKIKYPLDSLGQPTDYHYTQAFRSYLWRCQKTYRNDLDFFQFASETAWMLMGDCEDSSILTGAGLELLKAIDICDYFIAFGKVFKKDIFLGYHGWVIMKVDGIWRLVETTLDTPYANIHEIPQIDISTNRWTVGDITYEALLLFNKKWLWEWSEGVSLSPSGDIVNPSVKTPKSTLEHYLEKTHREKENKKKYKEMSKSYTKLMGKATKVK